MYSEAYMAQGYRTIYRLNQWSKMNELLFSKLALIIYGKNQIRNNHLPMAACPDFSLQDLCIDKDTICLKELPNPEYYIRRRHAIRILKRFARVQSLYYDDMFYENERGAKIVCKKELYNNLENYIKFPFWLQIICFCWTFNPFVTLSYALVIISESLFKKYLKSRESGQHPT